jgi:hypothetical protein
MVFKHEFFIQTSIGALEGWDGKKSSSSFRFVYFSLFF